GPGRQRAGAGHDRAELPADPRLDRAGPAGRRPADLARPLAGPRPGGVRRPDQQERRVHRRRFRLEQAVKVTEIETHFCWGGRTNWTFVKVLTDSGLYGW